MAPAHRAFSAPGRISGRNSCCMQRNCRAHALRQPKSAQNTAAATLATVSIAAQLLLAPVATPPAAHAVLTNPNARIARNPEAALRRATPGFNADVKQVQYKLEDVQALLRIPQRKPWGGMAKDVSAAQGLVADNSKMMASVPSDVTEQARQLVSDLAALLDRVQFGIDRKDPDKTSVATANVLKTVSQLEILQAPALTFQVPAAYRDAPLLTGRAVVEIVVEKANGAEAFVDYTEGGTLKQGKVKITVDGYSAPVNAGAFVKLVRDGKYNNNAFGVGYASVVTGKGADPGAKVPLEILPIGQFEPVYRLPLDVRGGELPVLPLSVRGSVAMGRLDDVEGFMSGEEWFIYKFDPSQAGLAGLSFDEGEFAVFGYVTEGMDEVVAKLDTGDRIVSATVVSGLDRLVNA